MTVLPFLGSPLPFLRSQGFSRQAQEYMHNRSIGEALQIASFAMLKVSFVFFYNVARRTQT